MGKVCKKHAEHPVTIYSQCIGCELERMTDELRNAKETSKTWQAEAVVQKKQVDKLMAALLTIYQESTDEGARDCAADALKQLGITGI
ncbi:hypothetical protein EDM54_24205 [Brevibacillus borstelensis]|jgi:hypothetical protein|uniref:hypothetical protein n=1 Tax=Brevibacillus borstelensis TaxID=45462 RepID=UPI000F073890|nr:hypothetical protein [Brevibacillus borstelensis]MED1885966.1 hypothetical protein [Brevibacillus borstelensis]RNB56095.1 hypothetical protein EDM54_24205 [Brevibacillus borstelensis]GED55778.1 hypothetical protein BBO01nite_50190 [Brevibacillus borstelensis]